MNKTLQKIALGSALASLMACCALPFLSGIKPVNGSAQQYVNPVFGNSYLDDFTLVVTTTKREDMPLDTQAIYVGTLGKTYSPTVAYYVLQSYVPYNSFASHTTYDDENGYYAYNITYGDWYDIGQHDNTPQGVLEAMTCHKSIGWEFEDNDNVETAYVDALTLSLVGAHAFPVNAFEALDIELGGAYLNLELTFDIFDFTSKEWVPYEVGYSSTAQVLPLGEQLEYINYVINSNDSYKHYVQQTPCTILKDIYIKVRADEGDSIDWFQMEYNPAQFDTPTGYTASVESAWVDMSGNVIYVDEAVPTAPIFDTVGAFFRMELFPGFSLSGLLSVVFGLALFFILLKVFLGG